MRKLLSLALVAVSLLYSCTKTGSGSGDVTNIITLPVNGSSVVAANNHFALNFLKATLQADASFTNKLISPLSIYLALGMVYNGADNATKDSMTRAMQLSGIDLNDLNATCKAIIEQLPEEDNKVSLAIANSIWYKQNTVQPLQSYLNINSNYFNAYIQPLTTPGTINNWVAENTKNKITKIIDNIPGDMLMFLVNAIYFKGDWQFTFKTQDTRNADFYLQAGGKVTVPFMQQQLTTNLYYDENYNAVEMPYGGGNSYSMYLLQNKNTSKSISEIAGNLDETTLHGIITGMHPQKISLIMPKWEYSYNIDDMMPQLSALGMHIAFTGDADFSKMYNAPVKITQAIHKTYIKVDEQGTEAAAVTGVGIGMTSAGPPETVTFDHPFLYVITEKQTGTIIFTGILNNPSQN
ncbi:MAG TPA: serpin family protein [Chitinophagaceae bacterium]|nr:serpin family protein [Chitinophagaceae bacterium]